MSRRTHLLLPLLALAALLLAQCSAAPKTIFPALRDAPQRHPVILVPGITGTELVDSGTGKLAWGNGARLITPRDGAYRLILPLPGQDARPPLEPGKVLEKIRLGPIVSQAYGPIIEMLEVHGYQRGELDAPRPGDGLFLFGYDWRRDNEETIRRLAEQLENLRTAWEMDDLEIDLICQSNGGHICRYLVKYGKATFAEAATGHIVPLDGVKVHELILVGTANGGSLRVLRELDRGRSYIPGVGRKMLPETLFTLPALYEDLPGPDAGPFFVDADGKPLEVDLYNAEDWQRYGWSIFGAEARKRALQHPELFGPPELWLETLRKHLDNARLLHELLDRDPPLGGTHYHLIQNIHQPTPTRAALLRQPGKHGKEGTWRLLFTGDKILRKRYPALAEKISGPGDGHATQASQMHLSPAERAAIVEETFAVGNGTHFSMLLQNATFRRLLEILHGHVGMKE